MGHQGDDEGVANNYNYYSGCKKAALEEVSQLSVEIIRKFVYV